MGHHLAGHGAGLTEVQAIAHVVETALQQLEHVLAGDALHVGGGQIVLMELTLHDAVGPADLLLLTKLNAVLGLLAAALAVHARGGVAQGHGALLAVAAVALQKQLGAFAAALSANGIGISCHC